MVGVGVCGPDRGAVEEVREYCVGVRTSLIRVRLHTQQQSAEGCTVSSGYKSRTVSSMWRKQLARAYTSVAAPLRLRGLHSANHHPSLTRTPFFAESSAASAAASPNPTWATVNPSHLTDGHDAVYTIPNLVGGEWTRADGTPRVQSAEHACLLASGAW